MDDGELRELMFEENSDLREGWDEEKCDWKEDDDYTYSDKFNDSVWETIYNWQMTGIDDVLSYALNEKEVN
jgi:hypothetical protein